MSATRPSSPCPPDDVLGALVQQDLADDAAEHVRLHVDACDGCAGVVAASMRGRALGTREVTEPSARPESASRDAVAIGERIGRYQVRALLGAGGMGQVYAAHDSELERTIALKVLRPEHARALTLTERLVRESRLMAKVSHPNVITVYDVGHAGRSVFIAMELIRGETLGTYTKRRRLRWQEIVELYERAGAGLAAAHHAGIIHRDFKPDNVLVELDDGTASRVVVTDFGIARASATDDVEHGASAPSVDLHLTSTGAAIGTPAYMAPEQLAGGSVDVRSDVFAFAASLWESLFGVRPFPGTTVAQIRDAMKRAPTPPSRGVPAAVVRALMRGLELEARDRWNDMTAFVRALTRVRARRRHVQIAAGATGLLGVGIAGALLLTRPTHDDPCARATLEVNLDPLHAAITDPKTRTTTEDKLAAAVSAWRRTHAATCSAARVPVQAPQIATCLDARKLELTGVVADLIADRGAHADRLVALVGDPAECAHPPPSALFAKVPEDPALRRRVTALRYRLYAADAARDHNELDSAIAEATPLVTEAAQTWPAVHAEALYVLGTSQSRRGDTSLARTTLQLAASIAATAHDDLLEADARLDLASGSTGDDDRPERMLEDLSQADVVLVRLGHPPRETAIAEIAKADALTSLTRFAEAETLLRHAMQLAEASAPQLMPDALHGLGYLHEQQGQYAEAVDAYRRALDQLPRDGTTPMSTEVSFRQRLAVCLAFLGQLTEAESVSREAIALAEQHLPPENRDRTTARGVLADILSLRGRPDEALAEVKAAQRAVVAVEGDRSRNYGDLLLSEAYISSSLGHTKEATAAVARACDIAAFRNGEHSADHASCQLSQVNVLIEAGQRKPALAVVEDALPVLVAAFGEPHPEVASALAYRGQLRVELGQRDAGIADLERAIVNFEQLSVDSGNIASARWNLARALWNVDRARAQATLDAALTSFESATSTWDSLHAEAKAWRDTHTTPRR